MQTSHYSLQQASDQSWSVVVTQSGLPVRLAGILQTGLPRMEAEVMLEVLNAAGVAPQRPAPRPVAASAQAGSPHR